MSLPNIFKPTKNFKLTRVGRDNDGGYLVSNHSILKAKNLISFGILDDISFEENFLKINNIPILCFDHTINKSYWKKRIYNDLGAAIYNLNFKFISNTIRRYFESKKFFNSKNIKLYNETIKEGSIRKILKQHYLEKPIFFKIDIEGSEYRILEELIEIQNSLCGLVIEFHDVDLHVEKIKNFIEKLQLTLTHIHPNNYGPVDKNNDPTVIEFTFEKQPIEISENCSLPNFLDQANNPLEKDIDLKFE